MSAALTQLVMDHVSQALFSADRLPFAIHLTHSLVPYLFQPTEWDVFLGNAVGKASSTNVTKDVLPRPVAVCGSWNSHGMFTS